VTDLTGDLLRCIFNSRRFIADAHDLAFNCDLLLSDAQRELSNLRAQGLIEWRPAQPNGSGQVSIPGRYVLSDLGRSRTSVR